MLYQCQIVGQQLSSSDLLEGFREGCTEEASREQKDILFMADWRFFNLWESLRLPKGFCEEHVCLRFNFYHLEASALLILLWCFGHKHILNFWGCPPAFTYRSHALAWCLFCRCRYTVYHGMNANGSFHLQCLKGQATLYLAICSPLCHPLCIISSVKHTIDILKKSNYLSPFSRSQGG